MVAENLIGLLRIDDKGNPGTTLPGGITERCGLTFTEHDPLVCHGALVEAEAVASATMTRVYVSLTRDDLVEIRRWIGSVLEREVPQ